MARFFNQALRRPVAAVVSGWEVAGQKISGLQRVDGIVSRIAHALSRAPAEVSDQESDPPPTEIDRLPQPDADPLRSSDDEIEPSVPKTRFESDPQTDSRTSGNEDGIGGETMADDLLKLVRYQVLFVKREYEVAFPERDELIAENMDAEAFTAWKIAEFIQELALGTTPAPRKWRDRGFPAARHLKDGSLISLAEADKRYLRVHFKVLDRFPRERLKYEERQIVVLEQIRDGLG